MSKKFKKVDRGKIVKADFNRSIKPDETYFAYGLPKSTRERKNPYRQR